ncbi:MAG TPA: FKBP-type peptidyl-prolyl cis-trans isomerase [Kofleriaceae bacterium]|nr:FKBP-type peptidyl-prolyl cis-trans isomerase [Kofleriaceae bacterium]
MRIIALAGALVAIAAVAGCSKKDDAPNPAVASVDLPPNTAGTTAPKRKIDQIAPPAGIDITKPPADATTTKDGLVFKSLQEGTGAAPSKNDTVVIEYTGWRSNGETFYSTKTRGKPLPIPLSNLAVGFVEAMTMMKKGGHAVFWLPPEIGYKGKAQPGAEGGPETLAFEVTLVDIKPAPAIPPDVAAAPADATKTAKGVSFKVLKPGTGKDKARYFDTVSYHFTAWDTTGRMFDTTEVRGQPKMSLPFKESVGLEDALTQMVVGERARFWIPPELAKGSVNAPGGTLVYEIELVDVKPAVKAPPPVPADVAAPPKDAKKTAGGVFYKTIKPGTGKDHPTPTDFVKVNYAGWTTDGRMFDSNIMKGQPAGFSLQQVVKGWTEGIPTMVVGETTRFWIPVELAYNHQPGRPDGMLVFDVELVSIEKGGPQGPPGPHGAPPPHMPPVPGHP